MARRSDDDFADEIRAHLDAEIEQLIAEGMSPDAARAEAHRRFGNVTRARERFHDSRRFVIAEQLAQDLRYAWRGLRQSRTFVATTVVTLAIGIGLVTAVFAVFNAYVLRPFAVRDPYSLYAVFWRSHEAGGSTFTWRDFESFQSRRDLFDGVIAESGRSVWSAKQRLVAGFVSDRYFDMLGARVALGRALTPDDVRVPGGEAVVVLSDGVWSRFFERDPGVLGRTFEVNGKPLIVVGVMAGEFVGIVQGARDIWIPITMQSVLLPADDPLSPGQRQLQVTARLRRDVTREQAQGSLAIEPFETHVRGRIDAVHAQLEMRATPVRMTLDGLALLAPIFGAFALVLLAASANASNVMLARAVARHREIGIRLSLGASRARIVRQLVTEGLLLALLAGAAALALAGILRRVGTIVFIAMLPPSVAARVRLAPLDFDHRVFLFALIVAVAVTTMFALLPALQATRLSLTHALRGHIVGAIRRGTLRNLLITSQVAVSLVLLVVAATLVRNSAAIRATDLGMNTDGIISVRPNRNDPGLIARAYEALAADPRVGQLAVASRSPLFGDPPRTPLRQPGGVIAASYAFASPDYFDALEIPVIRGRRFSREEALAEAPVAIVSAAGAKALWPGAEPIGQMLRIHLDPPAQRMIPSEIVTRELRKFGDFASDGTTATVIGVARDAVNGFVYQGKDQAHVYLPTAKDGSRAAALLVRGRGARVSIDTVRQVLQRVHPDAAAFDVLPIEEMVALQMFPIRAASYIGSLLSAIALALSISGLYGVLNYTFAQRTQEIGIRMAMGATRARVQRLVLGQSARLAVWGIAVGVGIAFWMMKLASTVIRLDNVSILDPGAFGISLLMIAAAIGIAACGPARRAARVDPSVMLRADG
jgi:predicted permease